MENCKLLLYGIILTDDSGLILDYNNFAKSFFNGKSLINKNIESLEGTLKNLNVESSKIQGGYIYTIKGNIDSSFLDVIVQNSYDEIFVTDQNGIALYCNNAFERNYGLSKKDIIGRNVNYLMKNNYVDSTMLPLVLETKQCITYEQNTKTNKTILTTSTPILDEIGNIMYIVQNCRDLTMMKQILLDTNKALTEGCRYKNELTAFKSIKKFLPEFKSAEMHNIYKTIDHIASKDVNILLLGEPGTGKSCIARRIHDASNRSLGPFMTINCTTIPENLIEAELFGYSKGAFTGAVNTGKHGLVELADHGTLFLDEIGELPYHTQSKLLELVQEKTFMPVGGVSFKYVDTRIIAATNQDIMKLVSERKFRADLYYRLAVATMLIPPLKKRTDDVEMLLNFYLDFFNKKHAMKVSMQDKVKSILLKYSWPGNIRELENMMEFLVINASDDIITMSDVPSNVISYVNSCSDKDGQCTFENMIEAEERNIIQSAYKIYNSSYKLAEKLSMSQSKANRLIQKYCNPNDDI